MRQLTTQINPDDAHRAWLTAERIKRVADRLIGLGPFSIGIDGLLAPAPLAGTAFSVVAGLWLLLLGVKARMAFYVGFRTLVSIVRLEGWLVDILFRGHMLAAGARDIAARFGKPAAGAIADAHRNPFDFRQTDPLAA
jgi:hypothetical protein